MAIKGFHSYLKSNAGTILGHSVKNYVNKIDVLLEAKKGKKQDIDGLLKSMGSLLVGRQLVSVGCDPVENAFFAQKSNPQV